jgi:hypothetical protein
MDRHAMTVENLSANSGGDRAVNVVCELDIPALALVNPES